MDIITTHGGIRTNSRMQVMQADGMQAIPGLYAAGIDISGVDSGDYSVNLSGHAFGFALAGGRLAAQEMLG
jgi:fumarate reductase flavoprotein subunit